MPGVSSSDTCSSSRRLLRDSQIFGDFDNSIARPIGGGGMVMVVNQGGLAVSSPVGLRLSIGGGPSVLDQPTVMESLLFREASPLGPVGPTPSLAISALPVPEIVGLSKQAAASGSASVGHSAGPGPLLDGPFPLNPSARAPLLPPGDALNRTSSSCKDLGLPVAIDVSLKSIDKRRISLLSVLYLFLLLVMLT
ncbi:hypothetical protein Salat_1678500 [Sesamum alatum]|uniref:Uncharacterized protein n=1 Tax=Sesamum alatum TaxID=300844 RepID=A0AAE2CK32_9LAMI|nr:hypothetical protein Salat_1678500 [Sesamum alatum]